MAVAGGSSMRHMRCSPAKDMAIIDIFHNSYPQPSQSMYTSVNTFPIYALDTNSIRKLESQVMEPILPLA